jgi:hypothetical protein
MLSHALRRVSPKGKTLTFITSATSTGTTITIPATAQAGDLAVLFDFVRGSTSSVAMSGWTATHFRSSGTYNVICVLSYKVLEAGDPGSVLSGLVVATSASKQLLVFRAVPAAIDVTSADLDGAGVTTNPSAQTVVAQTTYPYIAVGACAGSSAVPTWASTWYDAGFVLGYARLAYKLFNDNGASVSIDCGDSGNYTFLLSGALLVN